jgi:hypothetical protein
MTLHEGLPPFHACNGAMVARSGASGSDVRRPSDIAPIPNATGKAELPVAVWHSLKLSK